jgi:NAD-dependent dihydropyrimidine dehydrogenase PreA subunit
VAYVIAEPCIGVKDTACVDACPVDCIHPRRDEPSFEAERMLYIDPLGCVHCRACVPVCPVQAIFSDSGLPNRWLSYEDVNRAYYGHE